MPDGVEVRREIATYLQTYLGKDESKWIVKPQEQSFLSRGMHLATLRHEEHLNSDQAFLVWLSKHFKKPECRTGKADKKFCDRRRVSRATVVRLSKCVAVGRERPRERVGSSSTWTTRLWRSIASTTCASGSS